MKHSTSPFALGHSGDLSVGESKDCGKLFEVFAAVGQAIVWLYNLWYSKFREYLSSLGITVSAASDRITSTAGYRE